MASEKTPLVGGEQGAFYFYKRSQPHREPAGGDDASTEPLVVREQDPVESDTPDPANGSAGGAGGEAGWWPFKPKPAPTTSSINKIRKVPVKVEPKVFFSNERTFIAWMNMAVTLSTIAMAIVAFADHNPWSQVYGLVLMPVAVAFVLYALYQYMRRAKLIRQRAPGPYEDNVGPTVLATMLMVAIILNVTIKLYELYA